MKAHCYQCDTEAELSKRSRCVHCEYKRALTNEKENERLRKILENLLDSIEPEGNATEITLAKFALEQLST